MKRRLRARGVSFGAAPDCIFALDPVPRILTEPEWSELQAGIAQRLLALERGSMVVNSGQGGGAKDTWVPGR